ncbi:ketohydroxyglutarate aldolase [Merismopedia glauca]|uniref:Ketohydroxyglutarate aldolase n=1 Tax=Merismopedia glauca CCAP 1448/3 TaxID=1296344 RepID=A0A2T1C515_9CYAN|nr:ketohydroxyglutarate aldolase [Merismopedia glauca CCAP 1448/3]
MSQIKISVSVDEAHLPQIQEVSQHLQSSGMKVDQTLSSIGIISGSIPEDRLNSLRQIDGVQNVETQQSYQLAPPNSNIQ